MKENEIQNLIRWSSYLTDTEWKVLTYIALHLIACNNAGERITKQELMHGRQVPVINTNGKCSLDKSGFVNRRIDYGVGISEDELDQAIDGLWGNGLINRAVWLVNSDEIFGINWENTQTDPAQNDYNTSNGL